MTPPLRREMRRRTRRLASPAAGWTSPRTGPMKLRRRTPLPWSRWTAQCMCWQTAAAPGRRPARRAGPGRRGGAAGHRRALSLLCLAGGHRRDLGLSDLPGPGDRDRLQGLRPLCGGDAGLTASKNGPPEGYPPAARHIWGHGSINSFSRKSTPLGRTASSSNVKSGAWSLGVSPVPRKKNSPGTYCW